ncbi:alpha/beta fold hydrolase [Uliginosibacterium sp. H3]|uniref:Alpha/beta fold hydrolase n=1 Tax=Uliginosibacterium silvisoli TaxID=3114758 RepID=A0ABU6K896_9RHOO|nr:alpha/beta fold hydrolase [Uliginosibacterium sp. H3]
MAPIVLLHGWGLSPAVWAPLLAELGPDVLAPQLVADGGSVDDWAARQLDEIPAGAVVIGWSLGAMLAMAIAARAPQHISRLVLLAATPSFVKRADWPHALDVETTTAFRNNFRDNPARTLDRFIALQALGDKERANVVAQLRASIADVRQHNGALAHGLRLLEQSDLRGALPPASMRCLLIHGEQDALMPVAATHWLAQRWSGSETMIMPDVGHAAFLSQPVAVAARIRQFIHAS